jgi:hypothetical protein
LFQKLVDDQLNANDDLFNWNFVSSGIYSVKSMYLDLWNGNTRKPAQIFIENESSFEINIFMWFIHRKEILTKDNLVKRNWQGNSKCCL